MKISKSFNAWRKQMKKAVKDMSSKRLFKILIPVSIVFFILGLIVPYLYLYPEAGEQIAVPLHYNIHFGVDLFGRPWRVFAPSIVGLSVLVVNLIFAVTLWNRSRILSYGLLCATAVIEIILFTASAFVTLLVLSYL